MKAITTKYVGPSNVRGSRIIASDGDGHRAITTYESALDSDANHAAAALKLCEKMEWGGTLVGGHSLRQGRSGVMVWVWQDEDLTYEV